MRAACLTQQGSDYKDTGKTKRTTDKTTGPDKQRARTGTNTPGRPATLEENENSDATGAWASMIGSGTALAP